MTVISSLGSPARALGLGKNIESEEGNVVYIAIKNMRPKLLSRIDEVKLEAVG